MPEQLWRAVKTIRIGIPWILLGIGLYASSLYSYLLFHTLAELFSIIVACSIFILTWNTRQHTENHYLVFLGIVYQFIAILDLTHMLAYRGMNIFREFDANLPTQLWIAARYFQAIVLLIAPLFIQRKIHVIGALVGCGITTAFLLIAIFTRVFPDCYVEGVGLTPFKVISEYVISAMLIAAAAHLYRQRTAFDPYVYRLLFSSIVLTIGSELAFTFYVSVYDFSNQIGHFLKIAAFYLVYKAIVETGLNQPFKLMFRHLKQSEQSLRYLSTHDALTGLYNRLYFEEELARLEHGRQFPVSLLMMDLDGLKETNDKYGHAAGDEVLKRAANFLFEMFRGEDVVARIGGDEFGVILPRTDAPTVCAVVKRIRTKLAALPVDARVSLSLGASTAPLQLNLTEVLKQADTQMYAEKEMKKLESAPRFQRETHD